jgi:Fe2+ transport system protein FeoA
MAVAGESGIRRRLLEMGLCSGIEVAVLRRAPLGDPIELRVRGYLLSLRLDQAALIMVDVLGGDELRTSA